MEDVKPFEEYPARIALLSVGMTVLTYAVGAFILAGLSMWLVAAYLGFGLAMEYRAIRSSCIHCYYYGKRCGLGRGRLCGALFKRGDPNRFASREVSWPQMMVYSLTALIPIVGAIILAVRDATWTPILWIVALIVIYFAGNGIVRGRFGCKYCMQQRLGCPWEANLMKPDSGASNA